MDTMLILHVTLLLVVAVVPSYSDNNTSSVGSITSSTPITITSVKFIDTKRAYYDDPPKAKSKRGTKEDTTGFHKRQDESFTTFDEPDSESSLKDSFDIDDIDVKTNPSFDIEGSTAKGSSSFNVEDPNSKDTTSFDIDTPSFNLDATSFSPDSGAFNIESPTFVAEGEEEKGDPSFSIDAADFDLDEPPNKNSPSFESEFHNAKRSPSFNTESVAKHPRSKNRPYNSKSYESESYKPEASSIRSTSKNRNYDSVPKKNYNYRKSHSSYMPHNSYPKYSSTSPGTAYPKYIGSLATPNNQVYNSFGTTPYYENYATPLSSGSKSALSIKSAYANPSDALTAQKFETGYPVFQNLNSFSQQNSGLQVTQTPIYQTQYSGPKNSQQLYSSTHRNLISFSPTTQSFGKLSQNLGYSNSPLEFSRRATSTPVVQIQNTQEFPGFIQAIEAEPIVLNTANNFQSDPNFASSFDYGIGNQPFLSTTGNYQQQVIPVQSSSSTPQFPKFKGASIEAHSRSDYSKQPGSYQSLTDQPQLHFNINGQSFDRSQNFAPPKYSEGIKEDVEIINNKKEPQDESSEEEQEIDDDDLDEGYKSIEREYGQSSEEESSEPQSDSRENNSSESYSGEEPQFKSMPPMPPFVFKPYDDKVGRLHEYVNQAEPQSRFSEEVSLEDDSEYSPKDEYDQQPPKSYFDYSVPKTSINAYDDNDEEGETRRYQKGEDKSDIPVRGLEALRNYDRQYQKKFDDPYKKDPLENKYAYEKQSPAEDRTTSPKILKLPQGKNHTPKHIYRSSFKNDENIDRSIRAGAKRPIKRIHKNKEEHDTMTSFKSEPKVVYEESFGYKIPKKDEKLSNNRKSSTENSYFKKLPTDDSYIHSRRGSYKSNSPKKGDTASLENGDSYTFSSMKNWKSNKKSPEITDSQTRSSQQAKNVAYVTEDNYNFFSPERIRPGLSENIYRDFTKNY